MRIVIAILMNAYFLGSVVALDNTDFATCASVEGSLERLSCFDALAVQENLDGPQPQTVQSTGIGKWDISREKNPIDDTETVVLFLQANEGQSAWGDRVAFIARCKSDTTEAYINWNDYLGDDSSSVYDDWKRVTVRVGDAKAVEQRWSLSTDSKATFAPEWAGALLKQMVTSNSFIAQTTPYNSNPVTAVFDTTGMSEALKPLMEVCDWSLEDTP